MDIPVSLPTRVPAWLRARPFLLAGALRWANIHRRHRFLLPLAAGLLLLAAGVLTLPGVGHVLEIAAQNPLSPFASLAAIAAIASGRRKARLHRGRVESWLAPLAAPSSLLLRALVTPVVQMLALAGAIAIPFLVGTLNPPAATTLWAIVGVAYLSGSVVGWLSSLDKTATAPEFHYVTVRRERTNWAQAPALEPLSYWAVGQAQVYVKPKVAARAMLFVLLALPMGIKGEQAIAVAAGAWILLYVGSLLLAVVRIASLAARWLAPTTISYFRFTWTVGYRALLAQCWTWAWILFLTYAAGLVRMLKMELLVAVLLLLLSCAAIAGASKVAMRSAGMRSL